MNALSSRNFLKLSACPYAAPWLTMQTQLGLAPNTLEAYARALLDYTDFCHSNSMEIISAKREHIAEYVHDLATRNIGAKNGQIGFSNATMRQRLVAIRLYYNYLQEEFIRDSNPVKRGTYTAGKNFGGNRRGLLPHYKKLPWIPSEEQWQAIVTTASTESVRNRFMLALGYDAGLRREELCSVSTNDLDPSRRLLTLRAETTKTRRARVVPYSASTGALYTAYLEQRRQLSRVRGPLFLSESRRNMSHPLTIWTWSKVILSLGRRAGVPQLTTHTLRHLRLTDLARAGWDLHEIATFAGHRSLETTQGYIHLSGRELSAKLNQSMAAIHKWRADTMKLLLP